MWDAHAGIFLGQRQLSRVTTVALPFWAARLLSTYGITYNNLIFFGDCYISSLSLSQPCLLKQLHGHFNPPKSTFLSRQAARLLTHFPIQILPSLPRSLISTSCSRHSSPYSWASRLLLPAYQLILADWKTERLHPAQASLASSLTVPTRTPNWGDIPFSTTMVHLSIPSAPRSGKLLTVIHF